MSEVIHILTSSGVLGFIAYVIYLIARIIVTAMICRHPELSNDKVRSISRMMSKDKRHKFN